MWNTHKFFIKFWHLQAVGIARLWSVWQTVISWCKQTPTLFCSLIRNAFWEGRYLNHPFSYRSFHASEEGDSALKIQPIFSYLTFLSEKDIHGSLFQTYVVNLIGDYSVWLKDPVPSEMLNTRERTTHTIQDTEKAADQNQNVDNQIATQTSSISTLTATSLRQLTTPTTKRLRSKHAPAPNKNISMQSRPTALLLVLVRPVLASPTAQARWRLKHWNLAV